MLLVKVGLLLLTWAAIIQGGEWKPEDRERLKYLENRINQLEYGKEKNFWVETKTSYEIPHEKKFW